MIIQGSLREQAVSIQPRVQRREPWVHGTNEKLSPVQRAIAFPWLSYRPLHGLAFVFTAVIPGFGWRLHPGLYAGRLLRRLV